MAATLNVQFTDPGDLGSQGSAPLTNAIATAFSAWTRHFDAASGSYTINVSFRSATQPLDVSLVTSGVAFAKVGTEPAVNPNRNQTTDLAETSLGLDVATGAKLAQPALTLYVNPSYQNGSRAPSDAVAPIERELEYALGVSSLIAAYNAINRFTIGAPQPPLSVYDTGVAFVQVPNGYVGRFNGPNAQFAYGGPVPIDTSFPRATLAGGGVAVNSTTQGAGSIQPLDVALLRDAGLPVLTDQELLEHQISRLYVGAFSRVADDAGLIGQSNAVRGGFVLQQIGDRLVNSAEFAARYGNLSNADFVTLIYQNTLGRVPDATGPGSVAVLSDLISRGYSRGTLLASFTESGEARARLSARPNITYAAAAEEQVARLYDTAFGRDADPQGFGLYAQAVVNGTTLQQLAPSFLNSPEYANRYGASAPDKTLVDALYQNTLHRTADTAGESLFVNAVSAGMARADLVVAFSESQEHINLIDQRTAARDAQGFNLDISPHLGIVPMIGVLT